MNLKRRAKIGMLFIGAERFCPLGEGTADGTYAQRKKSYIEKIEKFGDVIHNGVVYTRERQKRR